MKKIGLFLSFLLCTMAVFAQNDVKVRFGGEAGWNMSKWAGDYEDLYGTKFRMGGNAGVLAEIQVNQHWSIQPEFLVSIEGTKTKGGTINFCENAVTDEGPMSFVLPDNVSAWYFKVPIWVLYSFQNVGPGRLSPGVGVYCAWAFKGKVGDGDVGTFSDNSYYRQVYAQLQDRYERTPQDFTDEDVHNMDLWDKSIPRRFDYGLGVKCMYELEKYAPGLFASINFTEGLTGAYNMNVGFSVGYKFKYCKWLRTRYNTGILEYNPNE